MRKIEETNDKEKSVLVTSQNTFNINQIEHLSRDSNGLSAFDSTQNNKDLQCEICNPPIYKRSGAIKLCEKCATENNHFATGLFENLRRHRRIVKLDRRCVNCWQSKTAAMMLPGSIICRVCAGELKTKGATARNYFIERAVNNFRKMLKGVAAL